MRPIKETFPMITKRFLAITRWMQDPQLNNLRVCIWDYDPDEGAYKVSYEPSAHALRPDALGTFDAECRLVLRIPRRCLMPCPVVVD